MVTDKTAELEEIKEEILEQNVGSNLAKTATQLVYGDGSARADIVFIGEAPGRNEDIQGKPFVGAAGKFLDEMLNLINLDRNQVYITNIVKYRPPSNRDPLDSEKQEFLPYLTKQLAVIKPKLIVTLGRHSTNCFLPDVQISKCHGQPKRYQGKVYLPLYHPAAALYNGQMRQTLIDDFLLIPQILKKINKT